MAEGDLADFMGLISEEEGAKMISDLEAIRQDNIKMLMERSDRG